MLYLFMLFPFNPVIFGVTLPTHLIMEIMAFFFGYRYYAYLKKNEDAPFNSEQRLMILIAAALGALVFSRLIGALENLEAWSLSGYSLFYLYGSKTLVGGLIGGWLFVEIAKWKMKLTRSSGDIMTFPILLAIVIGRIGCFSQGVFEETYGNETTFFAGMNLGDGKLRHPLALYEIFVVLCLALCLFIFQQKNKFIDGLQFRSMMLIYLLYRFIAEFFKPTVNFALGFSIIQWVAICVFVVFAKHILMLLIQPISTFYGRK